MTVDPQNPIVKLCSDGMACEGRGDAAAAAALFRQAWDESGSDFEAAVAAHYVARHQATPADTLRWNEIALARADASRDEAIGAFYPSLYFNVGRSHETLGALDEARRYFELCRATIDVLPVDGYRALIERGLAGAFARLEVAEGPSRDT